MSRSFLKKFFLTAAAFACLSSPAYATPATISINIKTSHYMDMKQTIKRIAVGNPSVATVVQLPGSASEFLIVTKDSPGSTALFVWTIDGARHEYLIVVSPEDPGRALLIEKAINLPNVHVKMVGDKILLTGTVENQYERNYVLQTARLFVSGGSESSLLVGSGFDMDLETQNSTSDSSDDLKASKSIAAGTIIDLLQILNPTQIRLEAQIIEINSDNAKDIGIEYGTSGSGGFFNFGENYPRNSNPRRFRNNPIRWVEQHFSPINATIEALVTEGKARVLSKPSVMTLSGEQATIQIGGKIPYTTTNSNGYSSTQFEDYGIILQFKPVVDAQNRINSMVHAEVSSISGQAVNGQPIISTRRADSVINLSSGSPIVIGGLMDSSETKTLKKIPLLGDIPVIGEFFKHTSKSRDKRELIIVVTPYLISADKNSQTPMSDTMREWYSEENGRRQNMDEFDFKKPYEEPELVDVDKVQKEDTGKKRKRKPKKEEVVEISAEGTETTEPFSSSR